VIANVRRILVSFSRLNGQRWRCGRPPLPPRARRSPGAAIAFDCRRHQVDGPRVAFGRRRCQGGVAVAASMARASTDGLGDAARAAPRPPPHSSFSWRRDHVRSPLSLMRSGIAVSMARTSTGPSPPPPPTRPSFPWLAPSALLSPWRRDRVRLSPSRRRSGRWSTGGCVFSYILSIVYPPPPAFFCPDLSPRKQTSLSLRLR
jgi:hypothetical protein